MSVLRARDYKSAASPKPPIPCSHIRVHVDDANAASTLQSTLRGHLTWAIGQGKHREVLAICIGTDRSTGDSLGPLVGSHLIESGIPDRYVIGTLDEPVHAANLSETLKQISGIHPKPFMIAIDACLGRLESVGVIVMDRGPVKPGTGVNKTLPPVGDLHITGIVNIAGYMEYLVLQNTRLSLVFRMARVIAGSIAPVLLDIINED
ncbi:MAG TPA: spore protease YyaC [Firmicutes bacterium]|nr:spore protease YyaC [Bacillota bacterium]HHY98549.1 spore protease YyaC [Bacillota bacterium]